MNLNIRAIRSKSIPCFPEIPNCRNLQKRRLEINFFEDGPFFFDFFVRQLLDTFDFRCFQADVEKQKSP